MNRAMFYPLRHPFKSMVIAIVIGVAVWLLYPVVTQSRRSCASTVLYGVEERIPVLNGMNTYCDLTGARSVIRAKNLTDFIPLGYDAKSGAWVFVKGYKDVIIYSRGKRTNITLSGLPKQPYGDPSLPEADLTLSTLFDGNVYVPSIENGLLVIYRYALNGKLIERRMLHVPVNFDSFDVPAVASNGSVAVSVALSTEPLLGNIYIFNKSGRVTKTIQDGCRPQISHDGRRLAYCNWRIDFDVFIQDLQTGQRRAIRVWPQPNARIWDLLDGPCVYLWDERNNWLICGYSQKLSADCPVYAADLSSNTVRWKRLPIDIDPNCWVLLDKAP